MPECLACGRPASVRIAGYDMAAVDEMDDADYCRVTEGVEGHHLFIHSAGGERWEAR